MCLKQLFFDVQARTTNFKLNLTFIPLGVLAYAFKNDEKPHLPPKQSYYPVSLLIPLVLYPPEYHKYYKKPLGFSH